MKINFKNLLKNIDFGVFILITSLGFVYSLISLYYDSTQSVDYAKYSNYLKYFLFDQSATNLEQGLIYFYLISFFINFFSFKLSPENIDEIFSLGIQVGNLFILITGLVGLFYLLKEFGVSKRNNLITLSIVCFFPQTIGLLVTLKPEILAFSLLTWSIYFIEKYFSKKDNTYLYISILPLSLLVTTKGSVTGMVGIFFIIKYGKKIKLTDKGHLIKFLIILILLSSVVLYENYQANKLFILDPPHDETIYNERAHPSVIYRINLKELISKPYQHEHRDSIIGIYLLDTFDDYFQLYWNFDNSLLDKNRKDLFLTDSSGNLFKLDLKNKNITYNGPFNFYLMFLRQYFAIILSFIFYFYLFRFSKKKDESKLIILSPLIGIFISVINAVLGFPQKNFDPSRADVIKTFYFSFFLIISFSFIVSKFLNTKSSKKYFLIALYFILILFILGFPKANNDEFDYAVSENNKYSLTCNINSIFLNSTLFETSNINCPTVEEIICDKNYFIDKKNELTLVNKDSRVIKVNNYKDCVEYVSDNYSFKNDIFKLKKTPFINLTIYILFILSTIFIIYNYEKK